MVTNGRALAAAMAAAIGSLAMGLLVVANEAKIYSAPALYPQSGGLSGRSTIAVLVWLGAWAVLDRRWKTRELAASAVMTWAVVLLLLGLVMTFPPVWALL